MQIDRKQAGDAGAGDEIRHQARADGRARRARAAVLTRITQIRRDRHDFRRRRAARGVGHQKQFHQAVVGRSANRLQQIDLPPAQIVGEFDPCFAVRKRAHRRPRQIDFEPLRHLPRQIDASVAGGENEIVQPRARVIAIVSHRRRRWSPQAGLGRQDSNLRMAGPKPAALPLGYSPNVFSSPPFFFAFAPVA